MLNPDFRDMLSIFAEEAVEYLVVGAYAMAAHGVPRATGDLDLWIRPSDGNARRALRALEVFGAPLEDLEVEELTRPDLVFQIGVQPNRIDLLTSIDGVTFEEAWPNRLEVEIDGIRVPVIGREELARNKRAVGRLRDRADLEALEGEAPEE